MSTENRRWCLEIETESRAVVSPGRFGCRFVRILVTHHNEFDQSDNAYDHRAGSLLFYTSFFDFGFLLPGTDASVKVAHGRAVQ